MKKTILFMLFALSLLLIVSCAKKTSESDSGVSLPSSLQNYQESISSKEIPKTSINEGKVHVANFKIDGMTCPSCALGVEYQLKQLSGVYDAKIDYSAGTAFAIYDVTKINAESIAEASTAYPAKVVKDEEYKGGLKND